MDRKKVVKLIVQLLCFFAAVLFLVGLASRFSEMRLHGFDLTEYWVLAVFGIILALSAGLYSLIAAIITLVRGSRHGSYEDDLPEISATSESQATPAAAPSAPAAVQAPAESADRKAEKGKKKTSAERRRDKLLKEDGKKPEGWASVVVLILCTVVLALYSVWSFFPDRLCFHNYAYNLSANESPEIGEIKNYRFYQDYLGRPYFIFGFDEENVLKVGMVSRKAEGDTVVYKFHAEKTYAKIVDKYILNKYTTVTVDMEVVYYVSDAHVVVNHHAERTRDGVITTYSYEGKIYSYKPLIS